MTPVKKAAKRKKVTARKATAAPAPAAQAAAPVAKPVILLVNGQTRGQLQVSEQNQTIGDAARSLARSEGLRSFAILVNGVQIGQEDGGKSVEGVHSLEVFAKDTRGGL